MLYQPPYSLRNRYQLPKKNNIGQPLLVTFKMLFKTVLLLVTSLSRHQKSQRKLATNYYVELPWLGSQDKWWSVGCKGEMISQQNKKENKSNLLEAVQDL